MEKKDKVVKKSVQVLQQEVQKRTSILLPVQNKLPKDAKNIIFVGQESDLKQLPQKYAEIIQRMPSIAKDGYKIYTDNNTVIVLGADPRGTLYGVGKLLRTLELRNKNILLASALQISSSPKFPVRGHQLGYRPKTNAYDAWTPEIYDAYIRDLALFGANSIEIMPPRTDDQFDNDHMVMSAMDMNIRISAICDSYGVDVWVWYPNLGKDFESAEAIDRELKEREEFFKNLSRIDQVFVPGGDPGDLEPDVLFVFLEKEAQLLKRYHPNAKIWVSNQCMRPKQQWYDDFFKHINAKPEWLGGVVYGPYTKASLEETRKLTRSDIPLRRYPDITHSIRCQYPFYYWDYAWAITLGRECINPRPIDEKAIHNAFQQFSDGSISYSEGINDDMNKFIWSDQDWNPETPVIESLRDYARLFIGPDYAEDFALAILALERNLRGPIAANTSVETTFNQFRDMEKNASNSVLSNYRFQMALFRAYYDAYIYRRYHYEKELELEAKVILSSATEGNSLSTLAKAKEVLFKTNDKNFMKDVRERTIALSDSLFRSIGMQLSIVRHRGREDRGNVIDHMDSPVSDAGWLVSNINRIEKISSETVRLAEIDKLLNRTNPGPGGIYDNFSALGTIGKIRRDIPWEKDPGNLKSHIMCVGMALNDYRWPYMITLNDQLLNAAPAAWMVSLSSFFTQPIIVNYENLDPGSRYKIRLAYTGRYRSFTKLYANDVLVHDFIRSGETPIHEFSLPSEALKEDGRLELKWIASEGERGAQVSELWIIKEK